MSTNETADEPIASTRHSRWWSASFGAVLGSLLGLVVGGMAHGHILECVLGGALLGGGLGFFLGIHGLWEIAIWWPW